MNALSPGTAPPASTNRSRAPLAGSDAEFNEIYLSHTFHEITMYYPMRSIISGRDKLIFNIVHELPYPFASDLYASPTWQMALQAKLPSRDLADVL